MLDNLKKEIVAVRGIYKFHKLVYEKDSVDKIIQNYDSYIVNCKKIMDNEISILKDNILKLEDKCTTSDTFTNSLILGKEKAQSEKVTLLNTIKSKDKTIDNLKRSINDLKEELNGKDSKNKFELVKKSKTQANCILKLDKQISKQNELIEKLKKEIADLKKR